MELERAGGDERAGGVDLIEDRLDIDVAMLGGEGAKPAPGFLQLALAPGAIAAPRLVPGDGDVNEALEEVALGCVGLAPGVLQCFVRGEELAASDQREAFLQQVSGRGRGFLPVCPANAEQAKDAGRPRTGSSTPPTEDDGMRRFAAEQTDMRIRGRDHSN
jgi:hypothetical protein